MAVLVIFLAAYGLVAGKLPVTKSAFADSQRIVSLYADGQTRLIPTEANTVGELLARANVKLADGDLVEPGADTPIPPGAFYINIYRSRPVVALDGQREVRGYSAYQNPKLVLQQLGIEIYPEDSISTAPVNDLVEAGVVGEEITVKRATAFQVKLDGREQIMRTQKTTIGEALAEHGVKLGPEDKVEPGVNSLVASGIEVTITRISDTKLTVEETIERPVETIKDDSLDIGQKEIKQAGSDGKRKVTYMVHYENGEEKSRQELNSEIILAAEKKVVIIGTHIPDDVWMQLAYCESGARWTLDSTYDGAFQFSPSTWNTLGTSYDYAYQAPPEVQIAAAQRLQARSGWGQWPTCARKLGLY